MPFYPTTNITKKPRRIVLNDVNVDLTQKQTHNAGRPTPITSFRLKNASEMQIKICCGFIIESSTLLHTKSHLSSYTSQ